MAFRNSITIVASPRPRVGKTLLARLLTDFHMQEGRNVAAFDLNSGDNTLSQFLPDHVFPASIGNIKGQMELFDRLVASDDTTKIVDLGHTAFESFFAVADQIDFAEEARSRGFAPAIMFMISPDKTAVDGYDKLRKWFPQVTLAPVHNELLGTAPHRDKYPIYGGGIPVRLPALTPGLRRYIEKPPFSFADSRLASANEIPLDVHIELQRWLRRIYLEFREVDLRVLLAGLQSSIKVQL